MIRRCLVHRALPWVLAVLAILLALPALGLGWQFDDYVHRALLLPGIELSEPRSSPLDLFGFLDGDPDRNRRLVELGVLPWWTLDELRLSFWRPLSAATHWLDYRFWPDSPFLMHFHSLVWFGVLVAVVALLYRQIIGLTWIAGLAALLYAVNDSHAVPAGWLANRNALVTGVFAALTLYLHDRARRSHGRSVKVLAPVAFVLALLSAEAGVAVGGYILAYALFLDTGSPARRAAGVLPYAAAGAVWLVIYLGTGRGAWGSGYYLSPAEEPLAFLSACGLRIPTLLLDQWGPVPCSGFVFLPGPAGLIYAMVGLLVLGALAWLLVPMLRTDAQARFWAMGMVLCLVPVCSVVPNSRLLACSGLGAMALAAKVVALYRDPDGRPPGRRPYRACSWGLIAVHLVLAPLLLPVSIKASASFDPWVTAAANSAPMDEAVTRQSVILVNPPIPFFAQFLQTVRAVQRQPVPPRLRILSPGLVAVTVHRLNDRTLLVRPHGGYLATPFETLYRGREHPMPAGYEVQLTDLAVRVIERLPDGRPAEVAFRFARPLEAHAHRWLRWGDNAYVPFSLPAVGDTIVLPPESLPF